MHDSCSRKHHTQRIEYSVLRPISGKNKQAIGQPLTPDWTDRSVSLHLDQQGSMNSPSPRDWASARFVISGKHTLFYVMANIPRIDAKTRLNARTAERARETRLSISGAFASKILAALHPLWLGRKRPAVAPLIVRRRAAAASQHPLCLSCEESRRLRRC